MLKTDKNINDLTYIINNLREEDSEEAKAAYGGDWAKILIEKTAKTDFLILTKNSIPFAAGGFVINPYNHKIACVWLLCTNEAKKHKLRLLKELKSQLKKTTSEFDILYNFIYKSNFKSKKWIEKLGFKFDNPHPENISTDADFHFFYKVNK